MKSRCFKLCIVLMVVAAFGIVFAACGEAEEPATTTTSAAVSGGGESTTTAPSSSETTQQSTDTTLGGKDVIVLGGARPLSGGFASFEETNYGPAYKLWVEEVNADGGIYVAEYGKKLPIELKIYDDQGDMDTSMRLITKLIEEDKVDFLLGNCSTAFNFAAAGVAHAHGYLWLAGEGGATTLEPELQKGALPMFFQTGNYSNHFQLPVFTELMTELDPGPKTCAIVYLDDLHGIEYQAQAQIFFETAGIDIVYNQAIPGDIKDMSSIVQQMRELDPTIVCSFVYPPQNMIFVSTMIQLGFSPSCVLLGPGGASKWFYDMYGNALDGCMFEGAWGPNSSPEAAEYAARLIEYLGNEANMDYWGALNFRAGLQIFQQAIEQSGTLDQEKIAEVMRTGHFKTVLGDDTFFDSLQILDRTSYAGQIGQWQNGVPEVIDPGERRTVEPIYPKPPWPAQ